MTNRSNQMMAAGPPDLAPGDGSAGPILEAGDTCWRIERAHRAALIVDAEDYFRLAKSAMLQARRSIIMIGWDFDTRIKLEPGGKTLPGPNHLGRFLTWLAWTRKDLEVFVLKWNLGFLHNVPRGTTPLFILDWLTDRRVHFRLDSAHPIGAAHHQKIVVIDDAIAFCGGIDMTIGRWDSRAHADGDPRRRTPFGRETKPWHDATLAVDGPAASALGDVARERWGRATNNWIGQLKEARQIWPEGLEPQLREVDVGFARTWPERPPDAPATEIERLTMRAIASARRTLYIESQYLASRKVAEAIASRLQEPDPPEIVLVLPEHADGWLEMQAMDSARRRLLQFIAARDRLNRFAAFYPVNDTGTPIYVHAKLLFVDDRLMRVGSSNLNNRSLGFDTECDAAIEAPDGTPRCEELRGIVADARDDLIAEHLGTNVAKLRQTWAATGSLIGAVRRLSKPGRPRLVELEPGESTLLGTVLAEDELVDPEKPEAIRRGLSRFLPSWLLRGW